MQRDMSSGKSGEEGAPLAAARAAHPRVLLAILAKQKEPVLPLYLRCIEALDYPKDSIVLHVRTNNNTDRTTDILREWVARVGHQYASVEFDASDVAAAVERFGVHEWNATRFKVLARIRRESMQRALDLGCDYYFVVDVDNFIRPNTLRELISVGLPIVAPLLRCVDERNGNYANFHEQIDDRGYNFRRDEYYWYLHQRVRGLCQLPVVHCTYLVRSDVIPRLSYEDDSGRHEYVVFSESARKNGVPQYLDSREVYGYLTLEENARDAMKLLGPEIGARILAVRPPDKPGIFACFGLHSSGSTWMFNLVREICRVQGIPFESLHRESEANLPWDALGARLIVVKSHNPMTSFQSFIAAAREPAVITVRDPRDAVASLMQRFGTGFDEAVKTVAVSAATLVALSRARDLPVLRYEDGFIGRVETFDRIAAMLGTSPSRDHRDAILSALAQDSIKRTIGGLMAKGVIGKSPDAFDRDTHWHANHVGDGEVGKFKRLFDPAQQQEIARQTREFCSQFGYETMAETGAAQSGIVVAPLEKTVAVPPTSPGESAPPDGGNAAEPAAPPPPLPAPAPPPARLGSRRQKICLAMIVKNEAPVIERCLASVLPLIDYWIIADTGSTDGTQDIIRHYLQNIPGELHERPWVDFAHNRSEALALARPHGDYTLIIDADDVLELPPGFKMPYLNADSYMVEIRNLERRYWRPQLVRNALPWRYEGVLHEFLSTSAAGQRVLPSERSQKRLAGVRIRMSQEGARRRTGDAGRYRADAAVLEEALRTETDPFLVARYTFYLAQSLMDAGDKARALEFYRRRATLGLWQQEVYVSLYRAALLMEGLGQPDDEVIAAFLDAHRAAPDRAEPLHGAARLCRVRQRHREGYDIARRGINLKAPADGLFIEGWIYDYGLLDELAVNAYWAGKYDECLKVCRQLLASGALPADHRQRVEANAGFARQKLREEQAAEAGSRRWQ